MHVVDRLRARTVRIRKSLSTPENSLGLETRVRPEIHDRRVAGARVRPSVRRRRRFSSRCRFGGGGAGGASATMLFASLAGAALPPRRGHPRRRCSRRRRRASAAATVDDDATAHYRITYTRTPSVLTAEKESFARANAHARPGQNLYAPPPSRCSRQQPSQHPRRAIGGFQDACSHCARVHHSPFVPVQRTTWNHNHVLVNAYPYTHKKVTSR